MLVKDISLKTPQENILYDDVLLSLAEKDNGGEVLRFWESNEYFVVLGRIGKEEEDVNVEEVKKNRIKVLHRSSGGGTVLQGKGCLNYTFILSKEKRPEIRDLKKSYQLILGQVVDALKVVGVQAMYLPISDIALVENQKKISGNAQKRGKHFIMHHGTILYDFDLQRIEQYLTMPEDIPEYRANRSHLDFVTNISASAGEIKKEIKNVFDAHDNISNLDDLEQEQLNLLL